MVKRHDYFEAGAVVVPARDGLLSVLGYDLERLDLDALGVVLERGSRRALVSFPELAKTIWLDFVELADIDEQISQGETSYKDLGPNDLNALPKEKLVWLLSWLIKNVSLVQVLELEVGLLSDVWDAGHGEELSMYYRGPDDVAACRISLGLNAFPPEHQKKIEDVLKERLLFTQIKPAGMHKFEAAIYLRR